MRHLTLLLVSLLAVNALAAEPPATPPGDPVAESRRIDEQIQKLVETTPIAKEAAAITARLREINERESKEGQPLYKQLEDLRKTPAWGDYDKKLRELQSQREDKWSLERKALMEAARRIYSARHEELRRLARPAVPEARALGLDVLTYPRIDGSTSTHPLNVIMASRMLDIPYEWLYPEPTGSYWQGRVSAPADLFLRDMEMRYNMPGSGRMWGNPEFNLAASRVVARPPAGADQRQQRIAAMINSLLAANTNTHDAYVSLIEGRCDLNLTAREPSASELKLASEKNVKLALKPIARDALVFIVNQKNPVNNLTTQQLRDIYEEKITRWTNLGGPDEKILPLRRERDSGSRELFDALVMSGRQLREPERDWSVQLYANGMGGPYSRATTEPAALAYSVYYYEHFMALSPATRTIAIDGVTPSAETIASGQYPFTATVYAACREGQPPETPAMKVLNWLLSPEGQSIVRESGYVPAK